MYLTIDGTPTAPARQRDLAKWTHLGSAMPAGVSLSVDNSIATTAEARPGVDVFVAKQAAPPRGQPR